MLASVRIPRLTRLLAAACLIACTSASAKVMYVNKNAPGTIQDGAAWATAFTAIQASINAASAGDEVWVAAGTYNEAMTLRDAVGLYGGFAGTETTRDARDPSTHVTTLNGSGHSTVTIPSTVGPATTIDGFTISGGSGTEIGSHPAGSRQLGGGGIFCLGSPVISNNMITGNNVMADSVRCGGAGQYACPSGAGWGGGIYCAQGSPTIRNNVIQGNWAETEGGGVLCGPGTPLIEGNTVTQNSSYTARAWVGGWGGNGGGIACEDSSAVITQNVIQNNPSTGSLDIGAGGGIYSNGGAPTISYNSILNNTASQGGGIYMTAGMCSGNLISGCTSNTGGGIYATGSTIVQGNVIDSNKSSGYDSATLSGGGIYADVGTIVASNLFANNTSTAIGGGCVAVQAEVVNNTFSHNSAVNGGALAISGIGFTANNIAAQNVTGVFTTGAAAADLAPSFVYNDVAGNTGYDYGGALPSQTGSHGNISGDPRFANATTGDYRLLDGSPCTDAGDDSAAFTTTDLDGKPRLLGAHIDIGAYEAGQPASAPRVLYVNRNAGGASHDGLSWPTALLTVQGGIQAARPADEVWVAAGTYTGNFTLAEGVAVYGGFTGSEIRRNQRDWNAHPSILDGTNSGPTVAVPGEIVKTPALDGFTVRNGSAGGILISGGAVIRNDTIRSNSSIIGAGISVVGSAMIADCLIEGNSASASGGGIAVSGTAVLANDTIVENSAGSGGGISASAGGTVTVVNTIVAFNTSGVYGSVGSVMLRDSDAYGNAAYNYSNVADSTGTGGNISKDPMFVKLGGGDFRLRPGSPCIDGGDDSVVVAGDTDLDGKVRVIAAHVDMGAYEAGVPGRVVYVNRNATGGVQDGASWATAFNHMQAGINSAGPGDEVWVAASTPTMPAYTELITLTNGVALYGGFAGTEVVRSQRDPVANVTVIDGLLKGTVATIPNTVTQAATLDGFTVRNGHQDGTGIQGAGIAVLGSAVISHNIITGNTAKGYAGNTTPFVQELGGGIYVSGTAEITGNTITDNSADSGGGIFVIGSGTIDRNVVRGNHACFFDGLDFGHGGGIYSQSTNGAVFITNNTVVANDSIADGGGIYASGGKVTIAANFIGSNSTNFAGGGIVASGGATIINNTVAGNLVSGANGQGGGIVVTGPADLANNTFIGNTATDGGGIWSNGGGVIVNNIIAFNATGLSVGTSPPTLVHNDAYENATYNYKGVTDPTGTDGNISADPGLSNRFHDIHLQPDSPCIDAGDDTHAVVPTDEYGKPRIIGAHVDIGADESNGTTWPGLPILYVSPNGDDRNDGFAWAQAKKTIGGALTVALGGDEVWVAKGVYVETVRLPAGLALYGGFAGTETTRALRSYRNNVTVIDGNGRDTVVTASLPGTVVDGFTVRNGGPNSTNSGGTGITAYGVGSVIADNIITGNASQSDGGGVSTGGGAIVVNNTINGNSSARLGGGVDVEGDGTILNNVITGNSENAFGGGGVYIHGNPTISGNVIQGNTAVRTGGGGIYIDGSPVIASNLIQGNSSGSYIGAGIYAGGAPSIVNNTIVANSNTGDGGAVYLNSSGATMINNIIANNSSGVATYSSTTTATLRNNDVYGNTKYNYKTLADPSGANGNTSASPRFVNSATRDYHLASDSPCVNAGDDSVLTAGQADLDGHPRKLGPHVDMGAYEFLTSGYYSIADVLKALRIAAGFATAGPSDITRLHLVLGSPSGAGIWLPDAARIARKAAGLEANP